METKVNKNSKSILSRLLATENIFVIHDNKAVTASFDIANRVLRLPVFANMSNELYDMLVGHEVAHALYTPFSDEDNDCLKQHGCLSAAFKVADGDVKMARLAHTYMNVVEDARIERLIKEKFAGIRRDFFIAYKELNDRDFFSIKDADIASMSFIDRINLFFKIGSIVTIPFSDEEKVFVDMVENTRTFDDVIDVTKKIWDYCKDKKQEDTRTGSDLTAEYTDEDGDGDDITSNENGNSDSQNRSHDNEKNGDPKKSNGNMSGDWSDRSIMPDECSTQQNFDKNFNQLTDKFSRQIHYHSIPKVNEKQTVVSYCELMALFEPYVSMHTAGYEAIHNESRKFVDESNRVVNILVQEFMAKKAAADHHRNSVQRTGTIDTVRMMNYKFSDDIFLRMKVMKKGKSHGLVFYTDLSGSMSPVLEDTFKQLIQMVLFCRRVSIPFEVYGFTTKSKDGTEVSDMTYDEQVEQWKKLKNNAWILGNDPYVKDDAPLCPFTLVNLFSSKMTKRELDISIRNVMAVSSYYKSGIRTRNFCDIPALMHLSSTPLIESIVAAMDMVPKFKSDNKLDIVHTVFLTDGEATGTMIGSDGTYCFKNNQMFAMDRNLSIESNMIKIFRTVTGAKAISFFLCDQKSSAPAYVINGYRGSMDIDGSIYEKKNKQYTRENWTTANPLSHGYDEKFIIRASSAVEYNDLEEILSDRTSNVGIRNGFMKAMNQNLVSRVMLNRFIELIATE